MFLVILRYLELRCLTSLKTRKCQKCWFLLFGAAKNDTCFLNLLKK